MVLAFKEWSYIVDALGTGKQSIILRKGGIEEDGQGFTMKGKRFLLFPTLFHQAKNLVKEEWFTDFNEGKFHEAFDKVRLEYYAEVAEVMNLTDWEKVSKLDPYHGWKEDIIKERFNRWEKNVHLLVIQVFKLDKPVIIQITPEMGGCKSWIELSLEIPLEGTPVKNVAIN